MANSWIDLAADSDDDSGPLNAFLSSEKPQKPAASLPKNVRAPYYPTSKLPPATALQPNSQQRAALTAIPIASDPATKIPNATAQALTTLANGSRTASTRSAGFSSVSGSPHGVPYVPVTVPQQNSVQDFAVDGQPEKRRKLSVPDNHTCNGSGVSITTNVQVERGTGPKNTQAVNSTPNGVSIQPLPSGRLLSVHSLNKALKENGTKTPLAEDLISSQPGELHSGRTADKDNTPRSITSTSPGRGVGMTPTVMPKMASYSHGNEEVLVDREEENTPTEHLALRPSPVKPAQGARGITGEKAAALLIAPAATGLNELSHDSSHVRLESASISGATRTPASHGLASGFSDAGGFSPGPGMAVIESARDRGSKTLLQSSLQSPAENRRGRKKMSNEFSEEECHLLIFLKEVKKLSWKEITKEYTIHYPGRSYPSLQGQYSTKLNRRDRSHDPPMLKLPPRFQHEAVIDWVTVHSENPGPRTSHQQYAAPLDAYQSQRQMYSQIRSTVGDVVRDYSSGAESAPRRERPRRAVPVKDYSWPRRRRQFEAAEEADEADIDVDDFGQLGTRLNSEEPPEELRPAPDPAVPVDNDPLLMDFDSQDASLAIAAQGQQRGFSEHKLPYLSASQHLLIKETPTSFEWDQLRSRAWQGSLVHVDFSPAELDLVERTIAQLTVPAGSIKHGNRRMRLQKTLIRLTEPKIVQLKSCLHANLLCRDERAISGFLEDALRGKIRDAAPRIERLAAARPGKHFSSEKKISTSSLVRERELGMQSRRGWKAASRPLTYQVLNQLHDTLGPAFSYTGASSDVHAVAWSPDGRCFAAGAICVDDPDSMQYNRSNNLLFGNVVEKTIQELGEHCIDRPKPDTGPNSTDAMYASQDPKLYKTVSSVAFSPRGNYMFSAGYDKTVCLWETSADGSQPELMTSLKHKAEVDLLSVSCGGLLATAAKKSVHNAIKVIRFAEEDHATPQWFDFTSQKAATRPDLTILPTALQFEPKDGRYLLAGFGANVRQDGRDTNGDICLWDLNSEKQLSIYGSGKNVFDVAFSEFRHDMPWFAVGCVAGTNVNRGTRSTVRLHSGEAVRYSANIELECRALDMNDLVWCPYDEHLIAAGCTSGRAYIWDIRRPDQFLHELTHGRSLMPLDDYIDPEVTDTGIRFLSWGNNASRLYTGSSDGVVKVWNVVGSKEDIFVKDLITIDSGIMSGAFSPDRSKLILGEVNGSITVLEVGRNDCARKDAERLRYIPYQGFQEEEERDEGRMQAPAPSASGVASAADLLKTGQVMTAPLGGLPIRQAVQGPNYIGPFDNSADAPFLREQALKFQHSFSRQSSPQCTISGCRDVVKVTSEEMGDSGRSADRIPDELRLQWEATGSQLTVVPGKSKCVECGRAARPTKGNEHTLCERCSFTCFRCGLVNRIQPATKTLVCTHCQRAWEIGVLGYECIKETDSRVDTAGVPSLKRYDKTLCKAKLLGEERLDGNASFGDEMNALTDYYLSLVCD